MEVLEEKNGNDLEAVIAVFRTCKIQNRNGKPVAIILHTEMGQGVDFMMGSPLGTEKLNDAQLESALSQLYVETEVVINSSKFNTHEIYIQKKKKDTRSGLEQV